jgi:hypothetical protein
MRRGGREAGLAREPSESLLLSEVRPLAQTSETYNGHAILTDDTTDPPTVTVDGQSIPVSMLSDERWYSSLMGYTSFADLQSLGRAVVDFGLIPPADGGGGEV